MRSKRRSTMHWPRLAASCLAASMLASLLTCSLDQRRIFPMHFSNRRCLRSIFRHMAHVFGTLIVECIKRSPQVSPMRVSQAHCSLKVPHFQSNTTDEIDIKKPTPARATSRWITAPYHFTIVAHTHCAYATESGHVS